MSDEEEVKQIDAKRIEETETHIFYRVGLTKEGVINGGFQSADELTRMLPYLNGLPITMEHPEQGIEVYNRDNGSYGFTRNVTMEEVNGVPAAWGEVGIEKDHTEIIKQMDEGELKNVSIGYSMTKVMEPGTFNGKDYTHKRTNVMPFHLALLPTSPPACPLPQCGIGADSQNNNSYIFGDIFHETPSIDNKDTRLDNMSDNDANTPGQPPVKPPCVGKMSVDALAKDNRGVEELVLERDQLQKQLDESGTVVESLTKERDELTKFKTIVEELQKKEIDELRSKVKETGVFEDAAIKTMGKEAMEAALKVADSMKKPGNAHVAGSGTDRQTGPQDGFTVYKHGSAMNDLRNQGK